MRWRCAAIAERAGDAAKRNWRRATAELEAAARELEETNRGVVALYAELEAQADELRRATELKSRFLSYMSHEFRTPIGCDPEHRAAADGRGSMAR